MKPILKWVGGKSQLLDEITKFVPLEFKTYFEPFFGGGAVFFELERSGSFLSDFNPRLVNFYRVLASNTEILYQSILEIAERFNEIEHGQKGTFYYEVRREFNLGPESDIEQASRLYFLNKTGFNGLYRENSSGEFNVPFGQKKMLPPPEPENFFSIANLLRTCMISHSSYEAPIAKAEKGDFVYVDPPYVPLEGSPSFTSYLSSGFGPQQQEELAFHCIEAANRGVFVIASNSYTPQVLHLYKDFRVIPVKAKRSINAVGSKRGEIDEALIISQ